ncbi:MAG TPA: carbon storage regulator [Pirellulales bacterium]|jgi:carbon storage regulator
MLVLSRKKGDWLVIDGGAIRVRVIEIKGETVRLGIDAPKEIPVHRHEVFERLAAAGSASRECLAAV